MWADRSPVSELASAEGVIRDSLPAIPRAEPGASGACCAGGDPVDVVRRFASRPGTVWLDDAPARRYLLAVEPAWALVADHAGCRVETATGSRPLDVGPWDALDALMRVLGRRGRGRLFGYLGYELAYGLEQLPDPPTDDLGLPWLWLTLQDGWLRGDADGWRWQGVPGVGTDLDGREGGGSDGRDAAPAEALTAAGLRLIGRPTRRQYVAAVERTVDRIEAGELFQTNLCRRLEAALSATAAWPLYRRLREVSPAARGAYLRVDETRAVLSVSPERYLTVRDGRVISDPIKGTRRRPGEAQADRHARDELLSSDKDAAELAMVVDLVRNDLGRVCRAGSVRVEEFRHLMELPGVFHTRARVSGELRHDADAVDLLRASFPPGSITGAPKIHAMAVAAKEEMRARGPAMGAIGWIDSSGDMDLSVAIRTATMGAGVVAYHAGCGIVADSDPRAELEESDVKAAAFQRALERLSS